MNSLDEITLKVPLNVQERTGAGAKRKIVSNGLPLPLGRVFDAGELAIEDKQGKRIAAGFYPLQKWQDGSWRFVLVNFLTDLKAAEKAEFDLLIGAEGSLVREIEVTEDEMEFTVDTGFVKFIVKKHEFNVIDRLWMDKSGQGEYSGSCQAVEAHRGGITALVDGERYTSADGRLTSIELERCDNIQAVIRAEGKLGGAKGLKLDYKLWIKAWAGSSEVELTFTLSKKEGAGWDDYFEVGNISIDIPLKASGAVKGIFGGKAGRHEFEVADRAYIYQNSSDSYIINGGTENEKVSGSGKSDKSMNTGWAAAVSEELGLGISDRWFWQTWPSALEINRDGMVSAQVWSRYYEPLKLYTGVSKTTDFRLYFFDTSEEIQTVEDRLKAFQLRTVAVAPPSWYCQQTKAIDSRLIDLSPENWPEEDQEYIRLYNDKFEEIYQKLVAERDEHPNYSEGCDGYGFMDFGDGWEYPDDYKKSKKWELTWWSNNYYDHPHCFYLQFFRTGELKYLDYALEHQYHLMDIDTASFDPTFGIAGEYKSCPSVMHIKRYNKRYIKENGEEDFTFMGQGGSWQFQGVESLFEAYYLTGTTPSLERGLESAEFAMQRNTLNLMSGARSGGHTLEALAAAYRHTWDERYLKRMNEVWQIFVDQARTDFTGVSERFPYRPEYAPYVYYQNHAFQSGVGMGGAYKYRCFAPDVQDEYGTDIIMRNTLSQDIWGRNYPEKKINDGWDFERQRWTQAADVLVASGGWLHPLFPGKGFLPILKQGAVSSLREGFPDRNKTFSQTFKYQWLTQYELAKDNIRNELYASFTANTRHIKAGEAVIFNNQSIGAVKCLWNFGDGETSASMDVNVSHIYNKPGNYDVLLAVEDSEGCSRELLIREYVIVE